MKNDMSLEAGSTDMELTVESIASISEDGAERGIPVSRRPVDLVHLARYTLGNRALEREVLELFRTQSQLYLDRLKDAESEQAWHDAAHTIVGSARGIGAWSVAKTAETAEELDSDAIRVSRDKVVESLESQIDEANGFIQALLVDA